MCSWGVGVQNMAREYLPRSALARASGDGLLRLQARSSYKCHLMQHPLHDWMPAIFPLAGADTLEQQHASLLVIVDIQSERNVLAITGLPSLTVLVGHVVRDVILCFVRQFHFSCRHLL